MRIRILSPFVPHRDVPHAGGRFLLEWVRSLDAHGAEVEILAPNPAHVGREEPAGLDAESFSVVLVDIPHARRISHRMAGARLSPGPHVVDAFRASDAVAASLATADIVEVQFSQFFPVASALRRNCPTVAVAIDVYSDAAARRFRGPGSSRERISAASRWLSARRHEARLLNSFDGVLTFSGRDANILKGLGVRGPIRRIAPWVELPSSISPPAASPVVLFVGDLSRTENQDAVRWFVRSSWPIIRAVVPDAIFIVAGAGPPADLLAGPVTGVEITGWVDDLTAVYKRARVSVAPLRLGAGFKFKVVQAMAHGLPVVATSVAADGFAEIGGLEMLAAVDDSAHGIAAGCITMLKDHTRASEIGRRAGAWIRESFDFEGSVAETLAWYSDLVKISE